jgi:probable rRNA maturation factor
MIEVLNRQNRYALNLTKFKRALRFLVERYRLGDAEVTLAFVGTKTIRKLNRDFRKIDAATDVLSFPAGVESVDGKRYLGDILISVPRAFQQCRGEPHGLEIELMDLVVHGFLHLVGYDHGKGIEAEEVEVRGVLEKKLGERKGDNG